MKKIIRTIVVMLLAVSFSMSGFACKKQEPAPPPPTPEQKAAIEVIKKNSEEAKKVFAAKVNGVEITMYDLVREMNKVSPKYLKEGEKVPPQTTATIKKEALDNLIFNELAVQEAVKRGVTVSPDKVNEVVKLMKEQMGTREAYQEYLDNLGTTEEGLKKRIERSHLLEMITGQEIYQKITVDEKGMRAEYEKNKALYKSGGKQLGYDEAAPFIKKKIISEQGAIKKQEWGATLKKKAKIEISKDTLK